MQKLIFHKKTIPFILEALDCGIDKDGYVINSNTKILVLDVWGDKFLAKNLKGVTNKGFFSRDMQIIIDPGII